ncbi:hypothetical protein [Nosocomiicoccus ampullae]|uniref:Transketolase n=1 Tax=Nosocomiicoccus ampullae TaxID=489910 RepID=A0A9Q2CZT7_9STAP|nr:hypothetical protein [Nosocomiicoccus ampullae]MBB5176571.1 transketolase [Nosocomiicoccus ampullae]QYA47548.1 hypothetical protein KPF49_03655 [Nosocomiicoccus ampullae]QYA49183.1 hypothetical protein KPF52_03925 [Nosocomiicoccus ampullae]
MELLVPLIIFAIGGIISYFNNAEQQKKQRENPRNIDFDKLNEKYQKSKQEAVDEFKRLKEESSNFEFEKEVKKTQPKIKRKLQDTVKKEVERPVETAKLSEFENEVKKERKRTVSENNDSKSALSFDKEAVVNGIIMQEVLGPPKSRQRRVR